MLLKAHMCGDVEKYKYINYR